MAITAAMVKELREVSGAGMMDCIAIYVERQRAADYCYRTLCATA